MHVDAEDFLSLIHTRKPRDKGVRREIDENGDLLVRHTGKADVARRKLLSTLAAPSWLDPVSGMPRR